MSRSQWFTSPFSHIKYAIVRNKKQCKKLGIEFEDLSLGEYGQASTNYFADESGQSLIVVYLPKSDKNKLYVDSLLCHECVHIWQEIKKLMNEKEPSAEFEAYSIQGIFQDLSYVLYGDK